MKSRYKMFPSGQPGWWAKPEIAARWLVANGWNLRSDRAYKLGKTNIPAPISPALYDLHDVACEEGVSASEIVQRIVKWAEDNGVSDARSMAGHSHAS